VIAFPVATVLGWFNGGATMGLGWAQQSASGRTWFMLGAVVDSLVLLAVVALLIRALPARPGGMSATVALTRAVPVVAVLVFCWVLGDKEPDPANRVWIGQAIGFVLVAALLAGSSLPRPIRAVVLLGVLPVCSFTILDGLIGGGTVHVEFATYVNHAAVAAATALYVAGVPALIARTRAVREPLAAPQHP
jgi:hypothetical protein